MIDYLAHFNNAVLTQDPKKLQQLDAICRVILANQGVYTIIQYRAKVPWIVVACIHYRECDQSFKLHLHNGDPLTARTVHVPEGRPKTGSPPFLWSASAEDALANLWRPKIWNLAGCLEFLERFNGMGYQNHGLSSPYLWDFTSLYKSGLFVADGTYDPKAQESRAGCGAILRRLMTRLDIGIDFSNSNSMLH